ncbi:MAG TPA: helix-turn-helix domain-containing protein [Xanthomonadaceae bacterium]|nr:helix-turn-helix domain-containing protein [Xanthomonadaceae bacterium]
MLDVASNPRLSVQGQIRRLPSPSLRPWIAELWVQRSAVPHLPRIEHVLPTGNMHLVVRLDAPPLRLFPRDTGTNRTVGHAVVGGARETYYVREVGPVADSVGAVLRPAAARALFGMPADVLAGEHVELGALWGAAARDLRQRLLDEPRPERRLDFFEAVLAARLQDADAMHPLAAVALSGLRAGHRIGTLVAASGYSHRHFDAVFRAAVGLNPKAHERLLRFRALLRALRSHPARSWAELAQDCGYADQSHLIREFRRFAGVPPGTYSRLTPADPHHLPIQH